MKKLAAISLICIYALATMGFSLKEFYCCGKLKTISVTLANDEKSGCKGDNKNDHCCKNKFQYFKVKDDHVSVAHISFAAKHFTSLHLNWTPLREITFPSQRISFDYRSNAPPLHGDIPIYISNCVFLIWFNSPSRNVLLRAIFWVHQLNFFHFILLLPGWKNKSFIQKNRLLTHFNHSIKWQQLLLPCFKIKDYEEAIFYCRYTDIVSTFFHSLLRQDKAATEQLANDETYTCTMHNKVMGDHPGKCPKWAISNWQRAICWIANCFFFS